jgi:C_GCAxxG_C_C family probable redox protein
MKTKEDIVRVAKAYFDEGFNCAEAILLAGAEYLGKGSDCIPLIATPFGGGLSGNGYICGAVNGALMAIGLRHGRRKPSELLRKRAAYKLSDDFLKGFIDRFGLLNCRELSGVSFKSDDGVKKYREQVHAEVCVPIVEFVAGWLAENLS